MSCFRLTKAVNKKITSAIAQFWWSQKGNVRGMHWLAWEKLCNHKKNGGLGFKNIEAFNTAMLAKQLWRLMERPESLFTRVFKGRYFHNTDPMDPKKVQAPSFGWRSITSARSLVNKGLIKRVGTGASINVWKDPWLPTPIPRSATCKFPIYPLDFKVNDYIEAQSNTWNVPLLEATIVPEDVEIIRTIPISRFGRPDRICWHYTKQGTYTVKSGYMIESSATGKDIQGNTHGPNIYPLQARAWSLKCPPKIKHFIWQSLSGCVPVKRNLNKRGIHCDMQCERCGADEESINHVLFECPPALQIWALSRIPSNPAIFPGGSIFENMNYLYRVEKDGDLGIFFPWIIWYIWKNRNDKVFKNINRDPLETLILAEAEGKVWMDAQEKATIEVEPERVSPIDQIDANQWWCQMDGSWKQTDKFSGQGWICNKKDGTQKLQGFRNTLASPSPLHVEVETLLWTMECLREANRLDVVCATDSLEMVKMVDTPMEWPTFDIHMEEFARSRSSFVKFKLIHIPRRENEEADHLAKKARQQPNAIHMIGPPDPPLREIS